MDRRSFLGAAAAATVGVVGGAAWLANSGGSPSVSGVRPLPILPLTDLTQTTPEIVGLKLGRGSHDFGTGVNSGTLGVNADYLGPVLRVKSGQDLPFAVQNTLDEKVALHWHGLHVPGAVDGGPHQEIDPGATWRPIVPIRQRGSMNWFHSHTHGTTAPQTYHGLAGVMLVEDDASLAADLPNTYGVDDLTLVLQDKAFDATGRLFYELTGAVFEDGFEGDTLVVNGAIGPVSHRAPAGLVRLRLLNASNARFLTLSCAAGAPLVVIASEGGFLASPVETATLTIMPGERYEVLIDMRAAEQSALRVSYGGEAEGLAWLSQRFTGAPVKTALILNADPSLPAFDGAMPKTLATLAPPRREDARVTRDFELNMGDADLAALARDWGNLCGAGGMGVNGRPMKMDRIDFQVSRGEPEIWRITADDMGHPFHIHGCSFRILRQNGQAPPAYAEGWKDMVEVQDGAGASEVLVTFDHPADAATPYMFHCHILEHEDCGMMGQFTVV
ncbi:MAG: multicopper oxidase domain-containing protein [Pseudomonadota bacterium]